MSLPEHRMRQKGIPLAYGFVYCIIHHHCHGQGIVSLYWFRWWHQCPHHCHGIIWFWDQKIHIQADGGGLSSEDWICCLHSIGCCQFIGYWMLSLLKMVQELYLQLRENFAWEVHWMWDGRDELSRGMPCLHELAVAQNQQPLPNCNSMTLSLTS